MRHQRQRQLNSKQRTDSRSTHADNSVKLTAPFVVALNLEAPDGVDWLSTS